MSRHRRQFFIDPTNKDGDDIVISGGDAAHIARVLRLRPGDTILAVVDAGRSYRAKIKKVDPGCVECVLLSPEARGTGAGVEVTLAQAVPKGRAMESIIRRAAELGASAVAPLETERSVSRLKGEKAGQKLLRWRKIAAEAAKQSSRRTVPRIMEVQPLPRFLQDHPRAEINIMLYEEEESMGLKEALPRVQGRRRVNVLVGAEGGFTLREVETARENGYATVSLGPRILRVDTASIALLSILMYEMGEMAP